MKDKSQIIIVDDEPDFRELVSNYLETEGFECLQADGGAELEEIMAKTKDPDLILLDVHMPGDDGFTVAKRVKELSEVAVIFLTGADDPVDRVVGLELGADDFIAKPVVLRELLARVRAVLRRTKKHYLHISKYNRRVRIGKCIFDLDAHKLFGEGGGEIKITSMQFDLLRAFVENPNRVLTRDNLLETAHNQDRNPFDRSIDIRISRIRKKIEVDPEKPQFIKTVRGTGYVFVPE
jgi:two-component system phosphate regulon response regulator OmpR